MRGHATFSPTSAAPFPTTPASLLTTPTHCAAPCQPRGHRAANIVLRHRSARRGVKAPLRVVLRLLRRRGPDKTVGKTALGLSSPAKPALQLLEPTSSTMAETSSPPYILPYSGSRHTRPPRCGSCAEPPNCRNESPRQNPAASGHTNQGPALSLQDHHTKSPNRGDAPQAQFARNCGISC